MSRRPSRSRESESSLLSCATEDELTVAQILLDLNEMMSLSESLKKSKSNWKCKRRRSCLDAAPATSRPSTSGNEIQERRSHIKAPEAVMVEKRDGAARTTASPDTPLSFSPSDESDDKSKHSSKKISKKRSREDYMDMVEKLNQSKESLRGEIENVMKYYNKLKTYNSQLKAIQQEVLDSTLRKEEPQMERSEGVNLGIELSQHYRVAHQQPLSEDPMVQDSQYSIGPITVNRPGSVNHVGPLGFDLNVPAEEALGFGVDLLQPLDLIADKRARYAEARRKRRGIIRVKTKSARIGV